MSVTPEVINNPADARDKASADPPFPHPPREGSAGGEEGRLLRLRFPIFLILAIAYLLPGLIGHDPWKQDELYGFGIVHDMLTTGDWVVPSDAGEPFLEKPPLFYWVAAVLAKLLHPWLPLHDGARLATGLFMALSTAAIAYAARGWWGKERGRLAALAYFACLGNVYYSHLLMTDISLVTGLALACAGFLGLSRDQRIGGVLLGLGVGTGFLSKGLLAPGVIGLTALLLFAFPRWRNREYVVGLLIASAVSVPFLFLWPTALYMRSPYLFHVWFWENNLGRYLGFSVADLGAPHTDGFWREALPWVTFPALPLALVTVWHLRRRSSAAVQACGLMFAVMLAVLVSSASARPSYAMPLLVPLSILAAPAVDRVPRWIDRSWHLVATLLFGAVGLLIWWVWAQMILTHTVPPLAFLLRWLPPDYMLRFHLPSFVLAVAGTLGAIYLCLVSRRVGRSGLLTWSVGLMLVWLLLSTLWMPWIDYAKSYRGVYEAMRPYLPSRYQCMQTINVAESERPMLTYVLNISPFREETAPGKQCDVLLIYGKAEFPPLQLHSAQWRLAWSGARPHDMDERFWLFVRRPPRAGSAAASAPRSSARSSGPAGISATERATGPRDGNARR